jgi:uncharacterized glyoxalase superfamily protein PhnB
MASHQKVQVPSRYMRVNAWVISRDTDAEVRFLASAFEGAETPGSRMLDPDGDIGHVEVEIGDSVIMLFDAKPCWPSTPAHLRVYVDDVVAAVERAVAAGARVVTRPTMLAFGERVARVRDPQGHLWWVHEWVEDVAPDELGSRFADPAAQEVMTYVQRTLRDELETAHGPEVAANRPFDVAGKRHISGLPPTTELCTPTRTQPLHAHGYADNPSTRSLPAQVRSHVFS